MMKWTTPRQLHTEKNHWLSELSNCPNCLCGETSDVFRMHNFCCRWVLKRTTHDKIWDDMDMNEPTHIAWLISVIIGKGSKVQIEPKKMVEAFPGLWFFDLAFFPVHPLKHTTTHHILFTQMGWYFTITSSEGHAPPSKLRADSKGRKNGRRY